MIALEPVVVFAFFFSSRRRHTRLVSDWSSDVCSSDLMSEEAESSDSFVTFPFSELVVDCTEVDQVEIDEQRLFAQLSADVVLLLLLPPHPAASTPRATTATTKLLPRAALTVLGIEQNATAAATQSIVRSGRWRHGCARPRQWLASTPCSAAAE